MTGSFWILLLSALIANLVSAYFLFKDKGLQETKEDGTRVINRRILIIYSIFAIVINILISVLFVVIYKDNSLLFSLKRLSFLALLWPLGLIDYKTYRIPNRFILLGLVYRAVILISELFFERNGLRNTLIQELIATLAIALAAFLCSICIKNSIGYGDIKLFLVMGLMLGLSGIWSAIFMSLLVAFVVSVVLLVTRKKSRKDVVPFAPAIMIGTYISVILTGM